jgi:hypothetical protein
VLETARKRCQNNDLYANFEALVLGFPLCSVSIVPFKHPKKILHGRSIFGLWLWFLCQDHLVSLRLCARVPMYRTNKSKFEAELTKKNTITCLPSIIQQDTVLDTPELNLQRNFSTPLYHYISPIPPSPSPSLGSTPWNASPNAESSIPTSISIPKSPISPPSSP